MNNEDWKELTETLLSRIQESLKDHFLVQAAVLENHRGRTAEEPPVVGTVSALTYREGGNISIEIRSAIGTTTWPYATHTPGIRSISDNKFQLYNGPSYLELTFAK